MVETFSGLIGLFILMAIQVITAPIAAEVIVISSRKVYSIGPLPGRRGGGSIWTPLPFTYWDFVSIKILTIFFRGKVNKIPEGFDYYHQWILWIRLLFYNLSDSTAYVAGIVQINSRAFLLIGFCTSCVRPFLCPWLWV